MAISTVVRLRTRLISQRTFVRTEDGAGVNDEENLVEVLNDPGVFRLPAIWDKRNIIWSLGSGWRVWYVCTTNAERTLENKPALNHTVILSARVVQHTNWLTKITRFWISSFHAAHCVRSLSIMGSNNVSQCFPSLGMEYLNWSPTCHVCKLWISAASMQPYNKCI